MFEIVLVHSPLVGAISLAPTQKRLIALGCDCHLPDPSKGGTILPSWRGWTSKILEKCTPSLSTIFIGHSMGGRLAAKLACDTGSMKFICLDAAIPPKNESIRPVEDEFLEFLKTLPVDEDHKLPPWQEWWPIDVFEDGPDPDDIRDELFQTTPRIPLDWFHDVLDMPDWSAANSGYIRTSRTFADDARTAEALGWPVEKLKGTHLHPASAPDKTAEAILNCCKKLIA